MDTRIITSIEQARGFWLNEWSICPGRDRGDYPSALIESYRRFATRELEHQWDAEEYARLLALVTLGNPQNYDHIRQAWRRFRQDVCSVQLFAEKLLLAAASCTDAGAAGVLLRHALGAAEQRNFGADSPQEQDMRFALLAAARRLAKGFGLEARYGDGIERCRLLLCGPADKEEAHRLYRLNRRYKPVFPLDAARERYEALADDAQERAWNQVYFDELTAPDTSMNVWVYPDVYAMLSRVYSRENAVRLGQKFADFRNCLSPDRCGGKALEIVEDAVPRIWQQGDCDLLEQFLELGEEMLQYGNVFSFTKQEFQGKAEVWRKRIREAE